VDDRFGSEVCISGDRAIVGACFDGDRKGAIYSFMRKGDSWKQISKRIASDAVKGENPLLVVFLRSIEKCGQKRDLVGEGNHFNQARWQESPLAE
jgi:hypothetical protein